MARTIKQVVAIIACRKGEEQEGGGGGAQVGGRASSGENQALAIIVRTTANGNGPSVRCIPVFAVQKQSPF